MRLSLLNRFQGAIHGAVIGVYWRQEPSTRSLCQDESLFPLPMEWGFTQTATHVLQGRTAPGADAMPPMGPRDYSSAGLAQAFLRLMPLLLIDGGGEPSIDLGVHRVNICTQKRPLTIGEQLTHSGLALGVGVWGVGIWAALKNPSMPEGLVPAMLAALRRHSPKCPGDEVRTSPDLGGGEIDVSQALQSLLMNVQTLVGRGATLDDALKHLVISITVSSIPAAQEQPWTLEWYRAIALALYCCLTTPTDMPLVMGRICQSEVSPPLTLTLAGAIAGALNGLSGIPLSWRLALPCDQELQHLGLNLFAHWSGAIALPQNNFSRTSTNLDALVSFP